MSDLAMLPHAVFGIAVGGPVQATIQTPSSIVIEIYRLPEALLAAYRTLWRTNRIGPKLKTVIAIVLPVGGILAVALIPLIALLHGYFAGFWTTAGSGLGKAIGNAFDNIKSLYEESGTLLIENREYEPDALPEGERPFDIRITESIQALIAGVICTPLEGVSATVIMTWRWPSVILTLRKMLLTWDSLSEYPVTSTSLFIVAAGLSPLLIPIAALVGSIVGLVDGFKDGYTTGVGAACSTAFNRMLDFWKGTHEIFVDRS